MPTYTFSENNSGGSWWLNRKQYDKLLASGWRLNEDKAKHYSDSGMNGLSGDVPWSWRHCLIGEFATVRKAVESWERATGEDFFAQGCNCCGVPFSISSVGEPYEYVSGSDAKRIERPW